MNPSPEPLTPMIKQRSIRFSPQRQQQQLLPIFLIIAIGFFGYEIFGVQTESPWLNWSAFAITAMALLPSFLWCAGIVQGIPIFILFTLPFIWSHALPLLLAKPNIINDDISRLYDLAIYPLSDRLFAGFTTAGYLTLATLVWLQCVKSGACPPRFYRTLGKRKGDEFFLAALAFGVIFNIANAGGWLTVFDPSIFSIIRSLAIALTALAAFVLAYRLGTWELTNQQARLFVFLLIAFMLTGAASLLLIGAATVFVVATAAFTLGRKRLPVLTIIIVLACVSLLHNGKGEIRNRYWFRTADPYLQVWEYPAFYAEWIDVSLRQFSRPPQIAESEPQSQTFLERSSLIQMLLIAQTKTPYPVPFLGGETYALIPQTLVPRILNPERINTTESTRILSLRYGLITPQSYTSIAWGLLAEAYTNFGLWGCTGLAIVVGAFYGQVTRWSMNAPITSWRSLYTVIVMTYAFQIEITASTLLAALSQAMLVLIGIAFVLMENQPAQNAPS
jgi:hypothetical protein